MRGCSRQVLGEEYVPHASDCANIGNLRLASEDGWERRRSADTWHCGFCGGSRLVQARDIVIGVIASPDHGGGYGKACVFAEELSRESILDARLARRCYGTTAAKVFLDVRVNGHIMGERLSTPPGDQVRIEVITRCPAPIDKIEVCRNNTFIDGQRPEGNEARVVFVDTQPLPGRSYDYVRVTLQDEEIARTSPVWLGEGVTR